MGRCRWWLGPHVLPHRLTSNHYRDFFLHHLPELLGSVPLAVRARVWCMHDCAPAHFSRAVRDILSNTYLDRWIVRGGPTSWLHARKIWILHIFYLWGHLIILVCVQLLLTNKVHFTIVLWLPVRLSATTLVPLSGCDSPWWDVSTCALNLIYIILSTHYKYTLWAIAHKLHVTGYVLMGIFFLVSVCGIRAQTCSHLSVAFCKCRPANIILDIVLYTWCIRCYGSWFFFRLHVTDYHYRERMDICLLFYF
jgi:hypothetical protein